MEDFVMLIFALYFGYVIICLIEDYEMFRSDVYLLKKYDTRVNRLLVFLLEEYKGIPGRRIGKYKFKKKWERNYIYYVKKVYRYIMILGIPWFTVVYFMKWYLNKMFIALHLFLVNVPLLFLPGLTFSFLNVLYDAKVQSCRKKERKDKESKNQH